MSAVVCERRRDACGETGGKKRRTMSGGAVGAGYGVFWGEIEKSSEFSSLPIVQSSREKRRDMRVVWRREANGELEFFPRPLEFKKDSLCVHLDRAWLARYVPIILSTDPMLCVSQSTPFLQ